uniref:Uncharacterized protein n=1 Tax=Oncorhynchus tshawytscha TaxID=74940 RepID=A0AAZ3SES2_ONCTS
LWESRPFYACDPFQSHSIVTFCASVSSCQDLERYLCQQERAELRKRELLHKRWTERVWTPIQRSVENQVPHCCYDEAERIRSMFLNYIHYCNSKVTLLILPEYVNWFPFFQVATPASMDPLFLQSRDGTKEKRAVLRCQTAVSTSKSHTQVRVSYQSPSLIISALSQPCDSQASQCLSMNSLRAPSTLQ